MTEQPRNATLDTPILSRPQPPETSGLKTVTIFVIVLLFHVAGIVGFLVWQATHQNNPDANLTQIDKAHHATDADNALPDNQSAAPAATGDTQTAPATPAVPDTITPGASSGDPVLATATAPSGGQPVVMPETSSALNHNNGASPTPVIPIATTTQASDTPAPTYQAPAPAPTTASVPAPATTESQYDAPEPAAATSNSSTSIAYVVKKGDTLARIAHRHHIKLAELKSANHLATDSVALGEKLIIPAKTQLVKGKTSTKPAGTSSPGTHAVLAADTAPSTDPATPAPAPAQGMATPAPSMSEPAPSPAPEAPVEGGKPYTVVHGDSMAKIAHKFHVTTSALIAANPNIADPAKLAIGDKLTIPPPHHKVKKTPTPTPSK